MTRKIFDIGSGRLRSYLVDYDAEVVVLTWLDGSTGLLTLKEARGLARDFMIVLSRAAVKAHKGGMKRTVRVLASLPESASGTQDGQ